MFRAAIQIIARDGLKGITLAKVGSLSGYSAALVTYRFGSKLGLLKAVAQRQSELWKKLLTRDDRDIDNEADFIDSNSALFLQSIREDNDFVLALLRIVNESYSSQKELLPHTKQLSEDIHTYIASIVSRGIERGNIMPGADAQLFAVIFIGTLRGVAMQYLHDPESIDLTGVQEELEQVCALRLRPLSGHSQQLLQSEAAL